MAETDQPKGALLSSLPLWVQAVSMVGFPIIVALFYMAKDVGLVPSVAEVNAGHIQEIIKQHESHGELLKEIAKLDRAICHSLAKDNAEHKSCTD